MVPEPTPLDRRFRLATPDRRSGGGTPNEGRVVRSTAPSPKFFACLGSCRRQIHCLDPPGATRSISDRVGRCTCRGFVPLGLWRRCRVSLIGCWFQFVCPLFVRQRNADQSNTKKPGEQPKPAYTCDYATRLNSDEIRYEIADQCPPRAPKKYLRPRGRRWGWLRSDLRGGTCVGRHAGRRLLRTGAPVRRGATRDGGHRGRWARWSP